MTDRRPLHLPGTAPDDDGGQAAAGRPRLLPIERAPHPDPQPHPDPEPGPGPDAGPSGPVPRARRPLGHGFLAEPDGYLGLVGVPADQPQ
ncbi:MULTISPECIES: hypothetical protein [Kitasatospora]|uniref:hypothetical protein n=1 Tax=Kitasatospora TaxID=2063 RepID=UPI000526EA48|nr:MULTISPECIES: hypothetical protein [Kitasatospora]